MLTSKVLPSLYSLIRCETSGRRSTCQVSLKIISSVSKALVNPVSWGFLSSVGLDLYQLRVTLRLSLGVYSYRVSF